MVTVHSVVKSRTRLKQLEWETGQGMAWWLSRVPGNTTALALTGDTGKIESLGGFLGSRPAP